MVSSGQQVMILTIVTKQLHNHPTNKDSSNNKTNYININDSLLGREPEGLGALRGLVEEDGQQILALGRRLGNFT